MRICHDYNDTMLARCGVAHFENTRAKRFIYFCLKSWIILLHRINVTISIISVNWFNKDMPRFQWHHARPMWICPLREHSCQMFHIFLPKSWITFLYRINVTISNISVNWFNEDMPWSQRHLARRMWSCSLREHSCQWFHLFQPKIMNHTVVQYKCDNFKYNCQLV